VSDLLSPINFIYLGNQHYQSAYKQTFVTASYGFQRNRLYSFNNRKIATV